MPDSGKVLIVDSDVPVQRLLSAIVRRNYMQPVALADGTSALLRLATEAFDVILLELALPRTDGSELLRVLASVMPHLLGRVIVVTVAPEETVRNCRHLGSVWKVLRKPVEVEVVEQELLDCYAERVRVAGRKPPHRANEDDFSFPIHRIAN
jgi:CheY-like chemotaxis protein